MKMKKKTKIALALALVLMFTLAFSFAIVVTSVSTPAENIESKQAPKPTPEYKNTGKCINCERQFGINTRWKGESNKCYDCETDMIIRSGDLDAAYGATKVKCFDC